MIEAEHTVVIDTGIENVWDYVQDITKWALLFPGCKDCEVIDEHHSKWIIKVGAGGLVKTVNVLVHVEQWDGPERVIFSYQLESEPVVGNGSYTAVSQGDHATEIKLAVKVEGSGQMAPMWEAMSKPLLPQMAKSFSSKLKEAIETIHGIKPEVAKGSLWASISRALKKLWSALFGDKAKNKVA